jgi:hypothetical protein
LDNGKGHLLLCGENVGADIGSSNFYRDYLHSTYITDDTSESSITGVSGDPISDPFVGSNLNILSSSPSEIAPIKPATTTFTYSSGGGTAAVKALHDVDSKVVYFAFLYFEGSDADKLMVMGMIIGWFYTPAVPIYLTQGWNLLSLPLEQFDTSLDVVLQSIDGEYDSVQWFDISDPIDQWKHSHNSKPAEMNDLSDISHLMSFWVHITTSGGTWLICEGGEFWMNQQIDLKPGWNMVGYPSLGDKTVDTALNNVNYPSDVDAILTYDAELDQWTSLGGSDNFELCRGYLIHSLKTITWDVPM